MEESYRLYIWIGYTGLALAVFLLVGFILFNIGSGDRVYQEYYGKELGMIVSSALTSNGNLIIDYNLSDKKGDYDFYFIDNCETRISKTGTEVPYLSYSCLDNSFIEKEEVGINLEMVRFRVDNGILTVEDVS